MNFKFFIIFVVIVASIAIAEATLAGPKGNKSEVNASHHRPIESIEIVVLLIAEVQDT